MSYAVGITRLYLGASNLPKCDELDSIHFLIAAQTVFSNTEATKCHPITPNGGPAHDAYMRLLRLTHCQDIQSTILKVHFVKPGRGTVIAALHIPPDAIEGIQSQVDAGEKLEPVFNADVVDEQGEVVAKVEKRLYVRTRK